MCPDRVEKRNTKDLFKRRGLKKTTFPWQFCPTVVCVQEQCSHGEAYAQWFLGLDGVKALEVFCGHQEGVGNSIYWIQSMFRHRAMNANISETSSITLAVGFPAPWPALVSTWMSRGLLCFWLRPTTY